MQAQVLKDLELSKLWDAHVHPLRVTESDRTMAVDGMNQERSDRHTTSTSKTISYRIGCSCLENLV
jgi:hypothetical protein